MPDQTSRQGGQSQGHELRAEGNTVRVRADVGGKGFNGPSRFTFALDGDKVRKMRITAD